MEEIMNYPTNKDELSENKSDETIRIDKEVTNTLASEEAYQNNPEDEKKISEILKQLCIKPMHSGYRYLVFGILLYKNNPQYYCKDITKRLYPAVAKKFSKSASAVASAIGRSIKKGINKCDGDIFKYYFGYTYNKNIDKITSGELIALVAEKIRFD